MGSRRFLGHANPSARSELPSQLHLGPGRLLKFLSRGPCPGSIKQESAFKRVRNCRSAGSLAESVSPAIVARCKCAVQVFRFSTINRELPQTQAKPFDSQTLDLFPLKACVPAPASGPRGPAGLAGHECVKRPRAKLVAHGSEASRRSVWRDGVAVSASARGENHGRRK